MHHPYFYLLPYRLESHLNLSLHFLLNFLGLLLLLLNFLYYIFLFSKILAYHLVIYHLRLTHFSLIFQLWAYPLISSSTILSLLNLILPLHYLIFQPFSSFLFHQIKIQVIQVFIMMITSTSLIIFLHFYYFNCLN